MKQGQIVFFTEEAIKYGIRECTVKSVHEGYCYVISKGVQVYARLKHLSLTRESALKKAEAQKATKIKSLTDQLEKIMGIEF